MSKEIVDVENKPSWQKRIKKAYQKTFQEKARTFSFWLIQSPMLQVKVPVCYWRKWMSIPYLPYIRIIWPFRHWLVAMLCQYSLLRRSWSRFQHQRTPKIKVLSGSTVSGYPSIPCSPSQCSVVLRRFREQLGSNCVWLGDE